MAAAELRAFARLRARWSRRWTVGRQVGSLRSARDVTVGNIQQVRAVWNGDRWELHIVCKVQIPVEDAPGDDTAGIDLGIKNYRAIADDDGDAESYPGNVLKRDKHHFTRDEYDTEGENGLSKRALRARQKPSRRKDHFLYAPGKHVVEQCIDHGVGRIAIGDLSDIREDETGDSRNWGKRGNKKLHGRGFDRFATLLEYEAEEHGILVDRESERDTSKTCSCCGRRLDILPALKHGAFSSHFRNANRVERGLYICESCGATICGCECCSEYPQKDNSGSSHRAYQQRSLGTASSSPVRSNLRVVPPEGTGELQSLLSQRSGILGL